MSATSFSQNKYHVSAAGNDGNPGTFGSPWRTLGKVKTAMALMSSSDTIVFRRDDQFLGDIRFLKDGLNIDAYGTGESNPVIVGSTEIKDWIPHGNGIYSAIIPQAKYNLNLVVIDSIPQTICRYPDENAANEGYITATKVTDTTKVIVPGASAIRSRLIGRSLVLRAKDWRLDRDSITAVSNTNDTVTYVRLERKISPTNQTLEAFNDGNGAFFMGDTTFLTRYGEWHFNPSTKRLSIFFGSENPASHTIEVGLIDTLVNVNGRNNIGIRNINFYNAGKHAIWDSVAVGLTIKNCRVRNSGIMGIYAFFVSNFNIENTAVDWALCSGIANESNFPGRKNSVIKKTSVTNIGLLPGMGSFNSPAQMRGIAAAVRDTGLVEECFISQTGKSGISFQGSNYKVRKNEVSFTSQKVNDDGAIYTFHGGNTAKPGIEYSNREISDNYIHDIVGSPAGTARGMNYNVTGIYLDEHSRYIDILNNTIVGVKKNAIHCNSPSFVNIIGNKIILDSTYRANVGSAARGISFFKWVGDTIINLNISNNLVYLFNDTVQSAFYYTVGNTYGVSLASVLKTGVTIGGNFINHNGSPVFRVEAYNKAVTPNQNLSSNYNISQWQTQFGFDKNSLTVSSFPKFRTEVITNPSANTITYNSKGFNPVTGQTVNGGSLGPWVSVFIIKNPASEINRFKGRKFRNAN